MTTKHIEVRFSDVDSQNHVNHVNIVAWIAHARVEMIEDLVRKSECEDLDFVLGKLSVSFPEEIFWPGKVEVHGKITKIGNKSLTSEYEVTQDGKVVATAECTNIFFAPSNKDTKAIPDILKRLLKTAE